MIACGAVLPATGGLGGRCLGSGNWIRPVAILSTGAGVAPALQEVDHHSDNRDEGEDQPVRRAVLVMPAFRKHREYDPQQREVRRDENMSLPWRSGTGRFQGGWKSGAGWCRWLSTEREQLLQQERYGHVCGNREAPVGLPRYAALEGKEDLARRHLRRHGDGRGGGLVRIEFRHPESSHRTPRSANLARLRSDPIRTDSGRRSPEGSRIRSRPKVRRCKG